MLGIVFSEFVDMVEASFSADMVDDILDDTGFETDGAYSTVGAYDHQELVGLVVALSKRTGISIDDLVQTFGQHLMVRFAERYRFFFEGVTDFFDFLKSVDNQIHVEVRKLYPVAELPRFVVRDINPTTVVMEYHSSRSFENLARGLIEGAADYFNQPVSISMETKKEATDQKFTEFTITTLP
ncbi:MAG: heme NO-binding domain-containing protein [Candidatus Bathyarchaeota archaeon]|uniref:heme NO-binding domain-containing protein n=1 Tax=Amphritea sp. TaxID=1872502 RepID=UPI0022C08245|nr:heme NO-binding domain-containing protein [Candidatus Bathyarchaeota archaeon]